MSSSSTPAIDTRDREHPRTADRPRPGLGQTTFAWLQLAGAAVLVNLAVYAAAVAAGAEMTADIGVAVQAIGPEAIIAATFGTLFISTFFWALVAHRVPAFAHLWVPIGWGVGLVSLGGILGAAGLATGLSLAVMHLATTAVAAHAIPRRLPR